MKTVVFDNSGTLTERYKAIKNLKTGVICDDISSIDIVDYNVNRGLVVLQTDPSKCLINANPNQTIHHFIKKNNVKISISYSARSIVNKSLLDLIKDDESKISDIQDTIQAVIDKNFNVQICTGSGFIMNLDDGTIEFIITSGGKVFKEVPSVVEELKNRGMNIYVASGDRTASLEELAVYIKIPKANVYGTADSHHKKAIINRLKEKGEVMMVGNSANDILALKSADIGVLTLQQDEKVPKKVYDAADYVIHNITEILDIKF